MSSRRHVNAHYIYRPLGDDTTAVPPVAAPAVTSKSLHDALNSEPVSTAAAVALVYHGYRRTGSIVWALLYGMAGKWFPIEAVPIAIAQGFASKKECK